jgi:hypothetical protein
MSERKRRLYRVEETLTIVGVAHVEAATKAEVRQMIDRGEVEFIYNDGQDIRRGDGIKIVLDSGSGRDE